MEKYYRESYDSGKIGIGKPSGRSECTYIKIKEQTTLLNDARIDRKKL